MDEMRYPLGTPVGRTDWSFLILRVVNVKHLWGWTTRKKQSERDAHIQCCEAVHFIRLYLHKERKIVEAMTR